MKTDTVRTTTVQSSVRAIVATALALLVGLALAVPPAAHSVHTDVASAEAGTVLVGEGLYAAVGDGGTANTIVRLVPGAERSAISAIEAAGGEILAILPIVDSLLVRVDAPTLEALVALDGAISSISLDRPVRLHGVDEDDSADESEATGSREPNPLPDDNAFFPQVIGADTLWEDGVTGQGVGVAMIDTGVLEIPGLLGRVVNAADFSGEGDGFDRFGHGTFTAGIIAGDGAASNGENTGVAPGAHLVSVKVAGADGTVDVSQILAAIQYVVIHKDAFNIGVLNLPLGTDSAQSWTVDPLNYAVQQAWKAGIVVVVAAGNTGPDRQTITKPADDPYVITVGSTTSNQTVAREDDAVSDFSARGPTRTDGLEKPDIVAPGQHIVSLRAPYSTADQTAPGGYVDEHHFRGSGTSFAAAVVSGAVALLREKHPDWTPDQIKGALLASAVDGPVGDRNVDGHGALDVAAAAGFEDPPSANAGLESSNGLGDFARARGKSKAVVGKSGGGSEVVDGPSNLTRQGRQFNATAYAASNWQGISWQQTQWANSEWQGISWQDSEWAGISWQEFEWTGISWQGISWQGISWQGISWQGISWQGISWQGISWQGISWQ